MTFMSFSSIFKTGNTKRCCCFSQNIWLAAFTFAISREFIFPCCCHFLFSFHAHNFMQSKQKYGVERY